MSVGKHFHAGVPLLKKAAGKTEIGLHLTLTEYEPLGAMPNLAAENQLPSIGSLILKSQLRQLNQQEIAEEVERQITAFEDAFGHKPHFIDGHQHAHILPGIREVVLTYGNEDCWIRQCSLPLTSIFKMRIALPRALLISSLSRNLKSRLKSKNIPHHEQFFGVNNFNTDEDYAAFMDTWLYYAAKREVRSLIMCHPGMTASKDEAHIHDPIRIRRPQEYAYLSSEQFEHDLNKYGLAL